MNQKQKLPCFPEYSTGDGTGVAEAVGNWGFSNGKTLDGGINRLKGILFEMDKLKCKKDHLQVLYNRKNDPESWYRHPSPPESEPSWTFPDKRPLITFNSTVDVITISSLSAVKDEMRNPVPGRQYRVQNSNKWYRAEPMGYYYQQACCSPSGHYSAHRLS